MIQEGRVFYREIERVLTDFDGISNVIRDLRRTEEPRLRIVSQSFLVQTLVPAALTTFVKARAASALHARCRLARRRATMVRRQKRRHGPGGAAGRARTGDPQPALRHGAGGCGAAGRAPPRPKEVLDARDLANEPFIALRPYTLLRKEIDRLFSELGLHLNIRCEASSGEAVCQLVAQGLGVTIEDPLLTSGFESKGVVLHGWQPSFTLTYGFLFPVGQEPTAMVLQFAETVAETAYTLDPAHVELISSVGRPGRPSAGAPMGARAGSPGSHPTQVCDRGGVEPDRQQVVFDIHAFVGHRVVAPAGAADDAVGNAGIILEVSGVAVEEAGRPDGARRLSPAGQCPVVAVHRLHEGSVPLHLERQHRFHVGPQILADLRDDVAGLGAYLVGELLKRGQHGLARLAGRMTAGPREPRVVCHLHPTQFDRTSASTPP